MTSRLPGIVALLSVALTAGCLTPRPAQPQIQTQTQVPAAQVTAFSQTREAVAQWYWPSARAVTRARVGFTLRFEVAIGKFTACGTSGEQYQVVAVWQWKGKQEADAAGQVQEAVPILERALTAAGWGQFRRSPSSGLDVMAVRQGITLSLDADPANPAPLERDWQPDETFDVTGPCLPANVAAASQLQANDYYGITPAPLPPLPQFRVQGSDGPASGP
jgi:hypothetical protein